MEDPWGSNAWSTTDSGKSVDVLPKDPPKWNTFERDADENTTDVGVPSWSAATDSGWGQGTNMWHAETSTLDVWKPSLSIDEPAVEPEEEPEEEPEKDGHKEEEAEKSPEPRPILPTPPLSPLPTISSVTPPSSPPRPVLSPPSPDPFGSFESAEILDEQPLEASSWTPKTPHFPVEAENEPWGGGWGGGEMEKADHDEDPKDEWALAQETRRKRDRKVPPELLESLFTQWDEFATTFYPKLNTGTDDSQSWRKGLDSVDGLAELVDSLIPVTSFPPPMPFNKTAVSKSVKETLLLTRFVPMAQASPMAHLHAAKGSTDWEKSVKAQKAIANDEWGWDLKHEPEENSEPVDPAKDKKGGGLLSFWSRKAPSAPSTPATDPPPPNPPKSPTVVSKATSPTTSTRPSTDSSRIASPITATVPTSSPSAVDVLDVASSDAPSAQPSAVSRFFNRFSRKPSAVATAPSGKEGRSSISLSPDDFSFLSDVTPSTSEGSLPSQRESSSANSLETMLSMPTTHSNKLPPPFNPPPRSTVHKTSSSHGSNLSFDAQMAETQFMDLLDNMMGGTSSKSGYAPVTALFSETSVEDEVPSPALQSRASPMDLPPMQVASASQQSLHLKEQSLVVSPASGSRSRTPVTLPILSSTVAPPFTPPINTAYDSSLFSGVSSPPIPSPRTPDAAPRQQTIALARLDNPLPPTPKRDIDDALSFLSTSPSSHSQLLHGHSPSTKASATTSLLSSVSVPGQSSSVAASSFDSSSDFGDFGDFGDFISTPLRTPSPPKVPQKTFDSANHKPTLELVEKAASRHGPWPGSLPPPLPQPLAPPPSSSPGLGGFSMAQSQLDFLTSDDTSTKVSSTPGVFPLSSQANPLSQPLFGGPLSRPTSAFFNQSPAPSIPATSAPRTSTPIMPPDSQPSKPSGASGLSAQDLSFFESL